MKKANSMGSVLSAVTLLGLNLTLFGTFSIYAGNTGEFSVPYRDVLKFLLLPGLAGVIITSLLAWLMTGRSRSTLIAVLMFLALASYAHGNLLYWHTGVLDGDTLDFSLGWRSVADLGIWLFLALALWRTRMWLTNHSWKLCAAIALFQAIGVLVMVNPLSPTSPLGHEISHSEEIPTPLSQYSRQGNVVHIILDAFQASIFESLVRAEPVLRKDFEGFTFFRDALTPSAVTPEGAE